MTVTETLDFMAGSTRFELATSGLTVQCANQAAPRARIETALGYTTPCPVAMVCCALRVSDSARRGATSGMQALTGLPGPGSMGPQAFRRLGEEESPMADAAVALEQLWSVAGGDPGALERITLSGADPLLPTEFKIGT